ncbi:MAG: bifunctional response regulator/alkaline phosphatase family protein [Bacteroidetes bacterium]|nr:bifunctional response regulator/alkaline phosphatase family protein [Bacteroidota bacterium]
MSLASVLWVDDEIEILEAHRLFLEMKGYRVVCMTNGFDALDYLQKESVDLILLDESMPGMSGLETLQRIKRLHPHVPVVLVTKNETESLMEEAIGAQITDYLIKPVNPNQVLLTLKKNLDNKRLITASIVSNYQQQFRSMFDALNEAPTFKNWVEVYRQLVFWELEMEKSDTTEMSEVLLDQKREANAAFFKFISRNYTTWINQPDENTPILSHQYFSNKILPHISKEKPLVWLLIDNFRYDQWKSIEPLVSSFLKIEEEDCFFSILPTTTHYCRNAIFSGILPIDMEKKFPDLWKKDNDEDGKNNHEEFFFKAQLQALGRSDIRFSYHKILNNADAVKLSEQATGMLNDDLTIIVYNFVDMISHARTDMEVIRELASDEKAYRGLTKSWFTHAPLFQLIKKLSQKNCQLMLSTDHGSIQVKHPVKVLADKQTTSNLRYKNAKNLDVDLRQVLSFKDPLLAGLPRSNISSSFIFAGKQDYFCYPNQYNHFVQLYKNSFQHGGISMEEMIVPTIRMTNR